MRLLFLIGAVVTSVVGLVPQSAASCLAPPPMRKAVEQGDIVLVGKVIETTNEDRWATVDVEEVWTGERITAVVEIKAGPADPPGPASVASSNDRTFDEGARYRPASIAEPVPGAADDVSTAESEPSYAVAVAVGAVILGTALFVRLRARR